MHCSTTADPLRLHCARTGPAVGYAASATEIGRFRDSATEYVFRMCSACALQVQCAWFPCRRGGLHCTAHCKSAAFTLRQFRSAKNGRAKIFPFLNTAVAMQFSGPDTAPTLDAHCTRTAPALDPKNPHHCAKNGPLHCTCTALAMLLQCTCTAPALRFHCE